MDGTSHWTRFLAPPTGDLEPQLRWDRVGTNVAFRRYFVTKGGADVMAFVVGGKFSVEERPCDPSCSMLLLGQQPW
eukprot:Skav232506  [mRNA]  locus=scaffold1096:201923:202150:+ [translate_table: standard]